MRHYGLGLRAASSTHLILPALRLLRHHEGDSLARTDCGGNLSESEFAEFENWRIREQERREYANREFLVFVHQVIENITICRCELARCVLHKVALECPDGCCGIAGVVAYDA